MVFLADQLVFSAQCRWLQIQLVYPTARMLILPCGLNVEATKCSIGLGLMASSLYSLASFSCYFILQFLPPKLLIPLLLALEHVDLQCNLSQDKWTIFYQEAFEKCWAPLPLRAAVTLPFTRCRYCRTPAIAIAQAACDVHDNDDNNNAWQRGSLWPHGMSPMTSIS